MYFERNVAPLKWRMLILRGAEVVCCIRRQHLLQQLKFWQNHVNKKLTLSNIYTMKKTLSETRVFCCTPPPRIFRFRFRAYVPKKTPYGILWSRIPLLAFCQFPSIYVPKIKITKIENDVQHVNKYIIIKLWISRFGRVLEVWTYRKGD